MKKLLVIYIIFSITIWGCSDSKKKVASSSKISQPMLNVEVPDKLKGFWVSEEYLKVLKETKSTKKACESGSDNFYKIYDRKTIMNSNIHEGGAENLLIMTSDNNGQILDRDKSARYSEIEFKEGLLLADGKKYIKAPNDKNGLKVLVNRTFVSGKYLLFDHFIEFKDSGAIIGLDSITHYELNLDYVDAGMQHDKIYLKFKNQQEPKTYLYEFNSDTLIILEINCLPIMKTMIIV